MTWLLLSLLGLLSTWLVYPNYQGIETTININEQIQQLYQDEIERNHQEEQKQILINDYFVFADKLGKINYARWCAWKYWMGVRDASQWKYKYCSSKSFDCGWAMKAYLLVKWIQTKQDISHMNSQTLYELGIQKDPRMAEKWDFMYRRWYGEVGSWNQSTHFAIVYSWYDGNSMWIYDNVIPGWQDQYNPHEIKLACNETMCHYAGKYRIYIATNWAIELANKLWIEVKPWIDIEPKEKMMSVVDEKNPLWFSVTVKWYAYDSMANRIASYWYDNYPKNDNSTYEKFATTMYGEASLDPERVNKKTGDSWVCQRSPIRHSEFINSSGFDDYMVQAKTCLQKWIDIKYNYKRANYRHAYDGSDKYKDKFIYMK